MPAQLMRHLALLQRSRLDDGHGSTAMRRVGCSEGCGACRVHITEDLDHVVLDEPNGVQPEDRARGRLPAFLVRLTDACRFRLP